MSVAAGLPKVVDARAHLVRISRLRFQLQIRAHVFAGGIVIPLGLFNQTENVLRPRQFVLRVEPYFLGCAGNRLVQLPQVKLNERLVQIGLLVGLLRVRLD